MKIEFRARLLRFLMVIVAIALTSACACAQDVDLSSSYQWKPVRIGAGGWMRGMAVSPSDATRRYARGDVDNVYRWDEATAQWHPTKLAGALPADVAAAPTSAGGGAIAIDPKNPDHVLVAYTFGRSGDLALTTPGSNLNVYYSTDGAVTFRAANLSLNGDLSLETSGERLAIDPNNGDVAYFGTPGAAGATDGLYRSLDGGTTWSQVSGGGLPVTSSSVRYEFALPRFDGGSDTVSADGVFATKVLYVTYIRHDETNNDSILAGGLLKSADGGATWTEITNTNVRNPSNPLNSAVVDSAGNLWVTDNSANLYKRTRSGTSWTTSVTSHDSVSEIAVDLANPQRIFVTGNGGTLARSLDGGQTWTDLGGSLQVSTTQPIEWLRPSSYRPQGHYISISSLYFDPRGNLWASTGNDGIITATPNDAVDSLTDPPTWSSSSIGIEEMVAQTGTIPPGGKPVLTVEDETLFTISDPDTLTAQHYPVDLWNGNNGLSTGTDVAYAPNQPRYLAELSDNLEAGNPLAQASQYSGYSSDGGDSWNLFPSITSGSHPCVLYGGNVAISARAAGHENDAPGRDNLVWIPSNFNDFNHFGQGPAPFYSKDGGATWTQTTSFDHAPGAVSLASPCASGPTSYTYMSFQWGPWIFSLAQHLLVADPVTPGTFYVHLDQGGFWKSVDGGVTWAQTAGSSQTPDKPQHGTLAAVPGLSGDMWLVDGHEGSTQHGLYHTADGGVSFTRNPNFDFAWSLALGKAASGKNYPAIYVYGRLTGDAQWGIFQSIDGGANFNRISYYPFGLIDVPNSLSASWDVFGSVYVGFGGNSYYYSTYTVPDVVPGAVVLSATAGDGQISLRWSAPSDGGTPINFQLYRGTQASKESATPIATLDAGTYTYTDTGLVDGTRYYYFVTATNGKGAGPKSNEVVAVPAVQMPAAPGGVVAFPGAGQIILSWNKVPSAKSYRIYRGKVAGGESLVPRATISGPPYRDGGLTEGVEYFYTVRAVNSAGFSPSSAEVQGKALALTPSIARITHANTPPVLDGSVSSVWKSAATYSLSHITGTIPAGQSNSATWQGLWDKDNFYVLVTVKDSKLLADFDSVEVYIDGNDGKAATYTSLDWQYIFQYGTPQVQQYSGGTQGTNTNGVRYGQATITGGYRIVAAIPWLTLGVTPAANSLIGIDVAINNFYTASTRANKLFWHSTTDLDYKNPSLFGTAVLSSETARPKTKKPVITPSSGVYRKPQTVHITSATRGAVIRYTEDGSSPTPVSGKLYKSPIRIVKSSQIRAIAYKGAAPESDTTSAQYVIEGNRALWNK